MEHVAAVTFERREEKKGTDKNYKNNPKTVDKTAPTMYLSVIPLHVNGLNVPIGRRMVKTMRNVHTMEHRSAIKRNDSYHLRHGRT